MLLILVEQTLLILLFEKMGFQAIFLNSGAFNVSGANIFFWAC